MGGIDMLRGVPEDTLLELGAAAIWERLPVGYRLCASGTPVQHVCFVTRGSLQLQWMPSGKREEYGAGTVVALVTAIAKRPSELDAHALSPVTVGWLHRDDLLDAMSRCPHLVTAVGSELAARLRHPLRPADDDRTWLDERIARGLIVASERYLRPDGIAMLPSLPSHAVWAALVGAQEADVRRSFARLERQALIRTVAGERLTVHVDRLKERARRW